MKHIVILGGGYGGLRIIQKLLASNKLSDFRITLVDKVPYHCLKTEYYALAAGTEADQHLRVTFPTDERLDIKYGDIKSVNLNEKTVSFKNSEEELAFDQVVIGLGCEDKYHGVPGAAEHTLSIQTIRKARMAYHKIQDVGPGGTVSIVGGGLSGVELASELRESRPDLKVILFDRGKTILSMFPPKLHLYVQKWLIDHGVTLVNQANITKVEENILYNHDEPTHSDAIIWTAGIQANEVVRNLDVEKDSMGRVILTKHHHIEGYEDIFVVGDCAALNHAPSAQLAEAQGEQIVMIMERMHNNEPLPEMMPKIKLKGVLGSLGKKHGFGVMGDRTLLGRVPRVLKSGVLWMYKYHTG
ncbi:NAD(P)/FAD-dependent oxidoreductase [Anaerobacillus alkaliphilus]|uniref:NAD(P)/FAD-dependent oxidoreductase n=1 Tax=Anaerobacillus alkaliphilus TaxID=1548597 RepID=A0A4Q0VUG1_9BACI|nr:NAD(P)/FAD-dependent oxidoreductase [Anaerobacillus alkaliphilus]RXJ01831.1 NAD(P)/FAD-dependent oxidoreductase [Anaerobacillus alkaliphilus]